MSRTNIHWRGKYPPHWDRISFALKRAAGWRCENCGHPHDPSSGHTLGVHHLDLNKSNCNPSNLVALCQRCHLHFEGRWNHLQLSLSLAKPAPWESRCKIRPSKGGQFSTSG